MSSTECGRPLAALIAIALLVAGCASAPAPKKPQRTAQDNVNVIRPVRQLPAAPAVAASDTEHVTTVTTASTETQLAAQQSLNDYFAGVQMLKSGKLDEALVVFQQIAAQHPTLSGPLVNEALIHYRQGRFDDALEAVERTLKVNDRNPFAWNLKGLLLREQGKFLDARRAYERALEVDPQYAKAHFNLGVLADLYMQEQRLALTHYEKYQSLQRKPDQAVGNWISDLRNRLGIVEPPKPAAAPATGEATQPATGSVPAGNPPAAGATPNDPATPPPAAPEGGKAG